VEKPPQHPATKKKFQQPKPKVSNLQRPVLYRNKHSTKKVYLNQVHNGIKD
jgi:hypothetical protein